MPEYRKGWKQVSTSWWTDPTWGTGGGSYTYSIVLYRWRPAYYTHFRHKLIEGKWEFHSEQKMDHFPSQRELDIQWASNLLTIDLIEEDERRLAVNRAAVD